MSYTTLPPPYHYLGKYQFTFDDKGKKHNLSLLANTQVGFYPKQSEPASSFHIYEIERKGNDLVCLMAAVHEGKELMYLGGFPNRYFLCSKNTAMPIVWKGFFKNGAYPVGTTSFDKGCWVAGYTGSPQISIVNTAIGFYYLSSEPLEAPSFQFPMTATRIKNTGSWAEWEKQGRIDPRQDVTYVDFGAEDMRNIGCSGVNFKGCNFKRTNFSDKDLSGVNFTGSLTPYINLSGASNMILPQGDYTGANFSGAELGNLNLSNSVLDDVNMNGAVFSGKLDNSSLKNISLKNAHLSVNFPPKLIAKWKIDFSGTNLENSTFQHCNLSGITFDSSTSFLSCDLSFSSFFQNDLSNLNFNGAMLSGTEFVGVKLDGATLSSVNFINTPPVIRPLKSGDTLSLKGATIQADVLGINWDNFDLSGATITGTTASSPFTFSSKAKPLSAKGALLNNLKSKLTGCDFSYANFTNAELKNVSLNHAIFTGATLKGTYLMMTRLNHAWLLQADLTNAYLTAKPDHAMAAQSPVDTAAELSSAYMVNAKLDGAHLDGVTLDKAILVSLKYGQDKGMRTTFSANKTSFILCDMNNALLVGGDFDKAMFTAADLSSAKLVNASFLGTNFEPSSQADSKRTDLSNADIRGAKFATEANGQPALMQGANLDGAKFTTTAGRDRYRFYIPDPTDPKKKTDLKGICSITYLGVTDSSTTCPDGNNGACKLT